jgi:hypothetical protein
MRNARHITLRIPTPLLEWADRIADERGTTRSQVLRETLLRGQEITPSTPTLGAPLSDFIDRRTD